MHLKIYVLYVHKELCHSMKEMPMLTLLRIRCPSAGAEDSLNISVLYHYETEIVSAHS